MSETNTAALLRKLLPDLPAWTWRDVTEHLTRHACGDCFVEVTHDAGTTIVEISDNGAARVWFGVDIDWCDVIAADVRGTRRYEADLDVLEAAQLPRVA